MGNIFDEFVRKTCRNLSDRTTNYYYFTRSYNYYFSLYIKLIFVNLNMLQHIADLYILYTAKLMFLVDGLFLTGGFATCLIICIFSWQTANVTKGGIFSIYTFFYDIRSRRISKQGPHAECFFLFFFFVVNSTVRTIDFSPRVVSS